MSVAVTPLPHMPSRGTQGNLILTFIRSCIVSQFIPVRIIVTNYFRVKFNDQ